MINTITIETKEIDLGRFVIAWRSDIPDMIEIHHDGNIFDADEDDLTDFINEILLENAEGTYEAVDPGSGAPIISEHLGEPVEVGGHDIDRDGPPSFV